MTMREQIGALLDEYRERIAFATINASDADALNAQINARIAVEFAIWSALDALTAEHEASARDAEQRERELRFAGGQLANAAFNLAQNGVLDARTRETLDHCRRVWDQMTEKHVAARAATREEVERNQMSLDAADHFAPRHGQ